MAAKTDVSSISDKNTDLDQNLNAKLNATQFTNISLDAERTEKPKRLVLKDPNDPAFVNKKGKTPKRVIHFSDGILEEYSETEDEDELDNTPKVDPKTLKWLPWFWYYMSIFGNKSLGAADMCGEKLAWFFGITSPKYQYAIDQYYELKKEEEEEKQREERELKILQERRMNGSHPDVEAVAIVPDVTFSNEAFEIQEESISKENRETSSKQFAQQNKNDGDTIKNNESDTMLVPKF